jgi:hypothetical protein
MSSHDRGVIEPDDLATKRLAKTQKITPFLWFDTEAEEAAQFYSPVFPGSRILDVTHYGSAGPRPEGMLMTVSFELEGQRFVALNLVRGGLRVAGRGRQLLGEADRGRRRGRAVPLAQGSLRRLVADRSAGRRQRSELLASFVTSGSDTSPPGEESFSVVGRLSQKHQYEGGHLDGHHQS